MPVSMGAVRVRDDGFSMSRKRRFQSLWLILLLFAETIQGLTPDLSSLASTRLLQLVEPTIGRGVTWAVCFLEGRHPPLRTETTPLPHKSSDPAEDEQPDEVCLASFSTAPQLTGDAAGDPRKRAHFTCEPVQPPIRSGWLSLSEFFHSAGKHHSLIRSLCRMTC